VVVAEKQSVAKDIALALSAEDPFLRGGCYQLQLDAVKTVRIAWADGHLYRLSTPEEYVAGWKNWRLEDLPIAPPKGRFTLKTTHPRKTQRLAREITAANEVVNACDAGREGELIFSEIIEGSSVRPPVVSRMWITATTSRALRDAFERRKPANSKTYCNLLLAAETRQRADWLLGMNLSRWVTLCMGNSGQRPSAIGRVKTPTLAEIYGRKMAIRNFTPQSYFTVPVQFADALGHPFRAHVLSRENERFGHNERHFRDQDIVAGLAQRAWRFRDDLWRAYDTTNEVQEYPPPPYSLNELQRAANREYGWSAHHTLEVAQEAYLKDKSISYPRTESHHIPEAMRSELLERWRSLAEMHFIPLEGPAPGNTFPPPFGDRYFRKRLSGDHHAILPTGIVPDHRPLPHEEGHLHLRDTYKLWRLVARRFMVCLLMEAELLTLKRILVTERDREELRALYDDAFVKAPGWMEFDLWVGGVASERQPLGSRLHYPKDFPFLNARESRVIRVQWREGRTEPPREHTDDSLLHFMAQAKLGTSATRASVIEELVARKYIVRSEGRYLISDEGAALVDYLVEKGAEELTEPATSKTWEKLLKAMERRGEAEITQNGFLADVMAKIRFLGALIEDRTMVDDVVFCPKSNKRVIENENHWLFPGYPKIRCAKSVFQRPMSAQDYRQVFLGGSDGGGPFEGFFSVRTRKLFSARLVYKPRKNRFEFDFRGTKKKRSAS